MSHCGGDVDNGGGCACVGGGGVGEISVPSSICREPKTVLKKESLKEKKKAYLLQGERS